MRLSKCSYDGYFEDLSARCSLRKRGHDVDSDMETLEVTATDLVKPRIAALIHKDVPRSWSGELLVRKRLQRWPLPAASLSLSELRILAQGFPSTIPRRIEPI